MIVFVFLKKLKYQSVARGSFILFDRLNFIIIEAANGYGNNNHAYFLFYYFLKTSI